MKEYSSGDIVTYYFILRNDSISDGTIIGWSDDKTLIDFYMSFHNCKNLKVKKMTDTIDSISMILEENVHDEIVIANLVTRGEDKREIKILYIPVTENEINLIYEECNTFFAGRITYHVLNVVMDHLKKKYREALDRIFLKSVIQQVIHVNQDKITSSIDLDQIRILVKSFPENFG